MVDGVSSPLHQYSPLAGAQGSDYADFVDSVSYER